MLYLLPAYLSSATPSSYFAPIIHEIILQTDHFLVEDEKTARKIIKYFVPEKSQPDLHLYKLDKYTDTRELKEAKKLLKQGIDIAVLSEAGMPCIADPGNIIVHFAHSNGIRVIPVSGPSSILLALVASGFNGQNFSFHGYLPIERAERRKQLLQLEKRVQKEGSTQIFMETPYRNNALIETLLTNLSECTQLCIAANIQHPTEEFIHTRTVQKWKENLPNLHKVPAIFLIGQAPY